MARIDQILLPPVISIETIKSGLREYAAWAQGRGVRYLFARVELDEIAAIQGLCLAGYTLIETRHTYYCSLTDYSHERYPVRVATPAIYPFCRRRPA